MPAITTGDDLPREDDEEEEEEDDEESPDDGLVVHGNKLDADTRDQLEARKKKKSEMCWQQSCNENRLVAIKNDVV